MLEWWNPAAAGVARRRAGAGVSARPPGAAGLLRGRRSPVASRDVGGASSARAAATIDRRQNGDGRAITGPALTKADAHVLVSCSRLSTARVHHAGRDIAGLRQAFYVKTATAWLLAKRDSRVWPISSHDQVTTLRSPAYLDKPGQGRIDDLRAPLLPSAPI